ncbi:hypothetical protein ACEN9X_09575 [Mucilaginibacter sp. Mucisp86]|uniref:hypothetical protein n=1 Tax=Mucilaginibacter sp. Mucisp86 TaxID=3243060 RepID=UPI0039B39811
MRWIIESRAKTDLSYFPVVMITFLLSTNPGIYKPLTSENFNVVLHLDFKILNMIFPAEAGKDIHAIFTEPKTDDVSWPELPALQPTTPPFVQPTRLLIR